ncbi:MAG: hypothetical protein IPP83_14940 [Flavobacteriales bacterium]|nr:hypothetical protein [Flavobacteriales bacterium]
MKLRANYFGVFANSGLALFIAAALFTHEFQILALVFLGIALYHIMHLKKVEVMPSAILIRYPLSIMSRQVSILADDLVSYRFSGGHYTESGAVFVKYRKENHVATLKIPIAAADWWQAKTLFKSSFPHLH